MKKKNISLIVIVILVSIIAFVPFYYTVIMSTYSSDVISRGLYFLPGDYLMENLKTVLTPEFFTAFKNSAVVSLSATFLSVLFSSMAGYALVAYRTCWGNLVSGIIMLTMMVPGSLGMIGYMQEMRVMGLSGTLIPLILTWLPNGFGVFWMQQYFRASLQMELVESARVDGCNEMKTFFRIVLPCCKPALISNSLLVFLWSWNSYMLPLVMTSRVENYTIPLYIQGLGDQYRTDQAAQITGLLLSVLPLIIAFAVFSKDFIRGLTEGAVKQ